MTAQETEIVTGLLIYLCVVFAPILIGMLAVVVYGLHRMIAKTRP